MSKTPTFAIGDRVAYSVQWLRSVGEAHTALGRARGVVTELQPFGATTLVSIDWSDANIPPRVNAANLARVGANSRFAAV